MYSRDFVLNACFVSLSEDHTCFMAVSAPAYAYDLGGVVSGRALCVFMFGFSLPSLIYGETTKSIT